MANTFEERRIALGNELKALFGSAVNIYFQPPENLRMTYPAVIYERFNINTKYADNCVYGTTTEFHVTIVDSDPDSTLVDKMSNFRTSSFVRQYKSNGLYHDVFKLFY